jgi:hypothetical protein
MLYLNKVGNIKLGGTENGLPKQFSELHITKTSKNGEENFEYFEGFDKGVESIKVMLPFVDNIEESFDVGLISFVLVNDSIKYYAKDINGEVLLFPLQPNFKDPTKPLPVINVGKTEDWASKLDMKERALLYTYIPVENSLDFVGGGTGTFLFKTGSAHTISEIKNTLELMEGMDKDIIRMVDFKLEVHTKLLKLGEIEEVTYVRLLPPSPMAIAAASNIAEQYPEVVTYLKKIEENAVKSKKGAIENAVSVDEASKIIGKTITFKLDENDGFEISAAPKPKASSKTNEVSEEMQEKAEGLAKVYNLPVPVVVSLLSKAGELAEEVIKKEKTVENIIKYIAA